MLSIFQEIKMCFLTELFYAALFCNQQTCLQDVYLGGRVWCIILAFECLSLYKARLVHGYNHDVYPPAELNSPNSVSYSLTKKEIPLYLQCW